MGQPVIVNHSVSHERTRNYISQIKGSIVFKGLSVVASFLAFPLMIHYLGKEQFGVWSTLLSFMSWIVLFDLGIGNGLRNKISESIAKKDISKAACYISSGYTLIGLLSLLLFFIMTIATVTVPWRKVFNTQSIPEGILIYTILIMTFFVSLNFWISLINQVFNALQKTSIVVFGQFLTNALSLVFVFTLTKTTDSSIVYLATAYGISLITSNIFLSFWFYRQRRELIPTLFINSQHIRPLLSMGMQFFTIQIAALVIFTTDKILIIQLFGPQHVTTYDVVFKLFSIITLIHLLITTPLWSSYTDSYFRGDFVWIKGMLKLQLMIFGAIILAVAIMAMTAKPIIRLWIGSDIEVSTPLVISMCAFIIISSWNNIFAYFVNGIGKVKPQLYSSIIAMLINIPLAILLTRHFGFGVNGIVWSTCISLLFFAFIGPIQVYTIFNKKSKPL